MVYIVLLARVRVILGGFFCSVVDPFIYQGAADP